MEPISSNYQTINAGGGAQRKTEFDAQTFLRLLTIQLINQNPLEPMNDRDFFAQMAQLGTVEGLGRMERSLQVAQASAIIGKVVTAARSVAEAGVSGDVLVSGTAERMFVKNGEYWLGLRQADGTIADVRLASVQAIQG